MHVYQSIGKALPVQLLSVQFNCQGFEVADELHFNPLPPLPQALRSKNAERTEKDKKKGYYTVNQQ